MEIRYVIFFIFVASAIYVYFRWRVRFGVVRSLTDYQVLLAQVNTLLYLVSKVKAGAFIPVSQFPELKTIQDNWEIVRQEALSLQEGGSITAATGYNDIGFNSFFRTGWKRFHLCWYGKEVPSAQAKCPKTVAILKSIPLSQSCRVCLSATWGNAGTPPRPLCRLLTLSHRPIYAQ